MNKLQPPAAPFIRPASQQDFQEKIDVLKNRGKLDIKEGNPYGRSKD